MLLGHFYTGFGGEVEIKVLNGYCTIPFSALASYEGTLTSSINDSRVRNDTGLVHSILSK